MLFVVTTEYVPAENERRLAARPAHREWLTGLKQRGVLVNGGPFADGAGAQLVFDVADAAELEQVLAGDPYPTGSTRVVSTRAWEALFSF
ncbi:MAG: YciI family protein [Actinomycetia bacterium]|nr:YciI family protein [Actinomycetes bacterium]